MDVCLKHISYTQMAIDGLSLKYRHWRPTKYSTGVLSVSVIFVYTDLPPIVIQTNEVSMRHCPHAHPVNWTIVDIKITTGG